MCVVVYVCLQFIEISKQYNNVVAETRSVSVQEYAQNLLQKSCSDKFPVLSSVRLFPDGRAVRHIAFLKVHKAASGSATSIFFRYGITRDLTFVLPKHINIISPYETIKDKFIYPRLNKRFDIMTSHVIYNRTAFEQYLHPDAVYIGILREPYQQFKSSMNYMAPKYVYNISKDNPIQLYLKNPMKYEVNKSPRSSWINNRQGAEFGVPDDVINGRNMTQIDAYVKKLDEEFDLVIITEYFDESVVLMRRMLNWKLKDILYRRLHIRGWDRKLTLPRPHDRKLYRNYALTDYALYDFFFKRLWKQISAAGPDFFDELNYFKKTRDDVDDFCKVYPNITGVFTVPKSDWNAEFQVDKNLCKMIFMEEEDWVKIIAQKQYNITKA